MEKELYREDEWNGFRRISFRFEDRDAMLVFPKEAACGKWLLKTEYFGAFPAFELEMLQRGWHLAYVSNITRWHAEEDDDAKARFCAFLQQEFALDGKCLPVGMSCGGMHAVCFAAKYPNRVSALYLDEPVLNLLSCPCGIGIAGDDMAQEFFGDTGMTLSALINYRRHPIDRVPQLLKHDIPVFLVCGDSDTVVPYCENGQILSKLYQDGGGALTEIVKPGCNHHPHGLEDNTPLIDFALKYGG